MRRISGVFAVLLVILPICFCGFISTPALAAATPTTISIQPTPPPAQSPDLLVTSIVGSTQLDYLEIYNQRDDALSLENWEAIATMTDSSPGGCTDITAPIAFPSGWLLPKKYLTFQRNVSAADSLTIPFSIDPLTLAGCIAPVLSSIQIIDATGSAEQLITLPGTWISTTVAQHKQRNNSPNSTRTVSGSFLDDYKIVTGDIQLDSDPLYAPPADTAGLQILEILPNARSCSPLDADPTCSDYIKLYNPTDSPINLAEYRLRIGYKGQAASVTNTFTWGQILDPEQDELILPPHTYFMLSARNDSTPLSITDSGNFVWLEDAYGAATYEPVIQYPDASSITKVGYAWAWDGSNWQWTRSPQPGAPNVFLADPVVAGTSIDITTLKPCAANQYRNPDTNRCNTITTAAATLVSCEAGQERNPETNRCRSIVTASETLTPCQPGWERNPDTNRCRKITASAVTNATTTVKDIAAPASSNSGWIVACFAVIAALAYAAYEWRQDITFYARKLWHLPGRLFRH